MKQGSHSDLGRFYFSIDDRSLALFRIAASMVLIEDWFHRWIDRAAFLGPDSVLPVALNPSASLFNWASTRTQVDLLMLGGLLLYLAFGLGWRTRIVHWLVFAFQLSLSHRNDLTNNAGDFILSCMLFWTAFLPCSNRFSWDERSGRAEAPSVIHAWAAFAVYGQLAVIYFASALSKTGQAWSDGTALYYFWNITFSGEVGIFLSRVLPRFVIETLSCFALATEFVCPFLILAPFPRLRFRILAFGLLVGMHLGIDLTFFTGIFQYVAIAALLPLISSEDWLWVSRKLPTLALLGARDLRSPPQTRSSRRTVPWLARLRWASLALFMGLCGYQAVAEAVNYRSGAETIPSLAAGGARLLSDLQLTQIWRMYAPQPAALTRWWVVQGSFADGSRRDLFSGAPVDLNRPVDLGGRQSRFWTRYLYVLPHSPDHVAPFLDYLERVHSGTGLTGLELIYVEQVTTPPETGVSNPPRVYSLIQRDLVTRTDRQLASDRVMDWKWEAMK